MIRVLIADDHAVVRRGLKQIVDEEPGMTVVAEAQDGNALLDQLRAARCNVVVLDLVMPGRGGLDLVKDLRTLYPKIPLLVLSMHPEEQFAVRALKAGAAGYLTKETAPEELIRAIRKVFRGGRYVSSSLAEKLAETVGQALKEPTHEILSDREFEVLRMIASGKSGKEIADELSVSSKTVSTYRARILAKLHLRTNAHITRYAIEHSLVL